MQEKAFLRDVKAAFEDIPGVENFEVLRQTHGKTDYRFALTMAFADQAAYEGFNKHPRHAKFLKDRWDREVSPASSRSTTSRCSYSSIRFSACSR